MVSEWKTRREKIMELLQATSEAISLDDLCRELDVFDKRIILEDLQHISVSLKRESKKQLIIIPARCKNCGFIFKKSKRFKVPSKCPKCKKERIIPFFIRLNKVK